MNFRQGIEWVCFLCLQVFCLQRAGSQAPILSSSTQSLENSQDSMRLFYSTIKCDQIRQLILSTAEEKTSQQYERYMYRWLKIDR